MLMMHNPARADEAKIICNHVDRVCPNMVGQYPVLYSGVFASSHRFLDEWDRETLLANSNILSLGVVGHRVEAAVSCLPRLSDNGLHLLIKGFVSNGRLPNIGAPLIAGAMRYAMSTSSLPISAEALVREIDGKPNYGPSRAFGKMGFVPAGREEKDVDQFGSHLLIGDLAARKSIFVLRFYAKERDLQEHSDWILSKWEELPV